MPIEVIKIDQEDIELYAPYSGICIYGEQAEDNQDALDNDPTCLFSYFEDIGWGLISARVESQLKAQGITNIEEYEPEHIVSLLDFKGGLAFQYNGGWNGISWFAFAPQA